VISKIFKILKICILELWSRAHAVHCTVEPLRMFRTQYYMSDKMFIYSHSMFVYLLILAKNMQNYDFNDKMTILATRSSI